MYIFLFWPFKVFGFIISLYAISALVEKFFPNIPENIAIILYVFGIPLLGLFWIDFNKFYFKFVYPDDEIKKTRKGRKKRKNINNQNILTDLIRGFFQTIEFILGLINPWLLAIIIMIILAGLAT